VLENPFRVSLDSSSSLKYSNLQSIEKERGLTHSPTLDHPISACIILGVFDGATGTNCSRHRASSLANFYDEVSSLLRGFRVVLVKNGQKLS